MPPHGQSQNTYTINIDKLDTVTPGKSVVSRVLAGNGLIEAHRTGFDLGSGIVTLALAPSGVNSGRFSHVDVDIFGRVIGGDSRQALVFTEEKQEGAVWLNHVKLDSITLSEISEDSKFVVPIKNGGLGFNARPTGEILVGSGQSLEWRKIKVTDVEGIQEFVKASSSKSLVLEDLSITSIPSNSILYVNEEAKVLPLPYRPEDASMKGIAGGYAALDENAMLDMKHIPAFTFGEVHTCGDLETMLSVDAKRGDVCIRTDEDKTYVLSATPSSNVNNWKSIVSRYSLVGAMLLQTHHRQPGGFWVALNSRCDMELRVGSALELGELTPEIKDHKLYRVGSALHYSGTRLISQLDLHNYAKLDDSVRFSQVSALSFTSDKFTVGTLDITSRDGEFFVNDKQVAWKHDVVTLSGDQSIDGVKVFRTLSASSLSARSVSLLEGGEATFTFMSSNGVVCVNSASGTIVTLSSTELKMNGRVRSQAYFLEETDPQQFSLTRTGDKVFFSGVELAGIVDGYLDSSSGLRVYGKQVLGRQQPAISSLNDNSGGSASATIQNLKTCKSLTQVPPTSIQELVDVNDSNMNANFSLLGKTLNDVCNDVGSIQNAIASLNAKLNQILQAQRQHGFIAT